MLPETESVWETRPDTDRYRRLLNLIFREPSDMEEGETR